MHKELPSATIQKSLKTISDWVQLDDMAVRERQIRISRQLKFYWDGITNIWWSDVAHDWQIWNQQTYANSYQDAAFYDKRANVFKAYLESIVAALSVTVPPIRCAPDDANNALDVSTASNGNKVAELLYKHNDAAYLWAHALFIYCTEGAIYGYNYVHEDEDYGTYEEAEYEHTDEEGYFCANCGGPLDEGLVQQAQAYSMPPMDPMMMQDPMMAGGEMGGMPPELPQEAPIVMAEEAEASEIDEYDPGYDEAMMQEGPLCPSCEMQVDPMQEKSKFKVPRVIGYTTKPKSRICMEAYGLLNVKVPNYAAKLKDSPYLQYSYETAYPNARERWQHLKTKVFDGKKVSPGQGGSYDPYESWGRTSTQYLGEYPENVVTIRNLWLRPSAFYILNESPDVDELCKLYPKGCKVIFVNDEFAEACAEVLDDHWTATRNPLSDHINFNPLGLLLTSIQDITNELLSLILQTIEHGIPQTFVDPGVVDLNKYRQTEVAPGTLYPATPKAGKTVADGFYEVKTATLSQEVMPFGDMIQQLGQFTSGALPSLFGGAQPGSSNTASEYLTSKNQAMQRLQTPWKMISLWWKDMFGKAIPAFMKEIVEDEKFVTKDSLGNYINSFIRKAELEGKIGDYELESAENLPLSWMQKKDVLMQFLQAANPVVMEALVAPENLPLLADVVGLSGITLPGENDRQVQLEEIVDLFNSAPIPQGIDEMGVPSEGPSVPIEPDVDNHQIHIQICKNWLTSEPGRLAKVENEMGYMNVLLHMKMHQEYEQMMMMQQMEQQAMMSLAQGGPGKEGAGQPKGKPANDKTMAPPTDAAHETTV